MDWYSLSDVGGVTSFVFGLRALERVDFSVPCWLLSDSLPFTLAVT